MYYRCGRPPFSQERNGYVSGDGHVNDEMKKNELFHGQRLCQGRVGEYCPRGHVRLICWRSIIPTQLSPRPRNKVVLWAPEERMITFLEILCPDDVKENTFSCDGFVTTITEYFATAHTVPFIHSFLYPSMFFFAPLRYLDKASILDRKITAPVHRKLEAGDFST